MSSETDIKELVDAFKGYRDLLTPVAEGLEDFVGTYDNMRGNIDRLTDAFSGDIKANLESIYNNLAEQAGKAADLSSRIEKFQSVAEKYTKEVTAMLTHMARVEERLSALSSIEKKAEEQIGKLDSLLEEKKSAYNVKDLERTLSSYNANVQKVSEFINRDVAEGVTANKKKLDSVTESLEGVLKYQKEEKDGLESLLERFSETGSLIKRIAEKGEVNEVYIFEILDKWAASRKVKTKK